METILYEMFSLVKLYRPDQGNPERDIKTIQTLTKSSVWRTKLISQQSTLAHMNVAPFLLGKSALARG